ncbi:helix-turn-helix domain-containing protein [Parafrankia discariae]|uniref:helix-turn-helix domain-containing protein n=1 Tax=Parafrankia discariae TaxID=365528 RepID=UPI00036A8E8D|nr:helix-turn-helix transcriptional regulator [Parafrankia discariae]
MPSTSKALRVQAIHLRSLGWTYQRIALELRLRHRVNARVAYRLAHGWTQEEVARRWNERWPGPGVAKTGKTISYWEVWPARGGRAPSAHTLARLAALYHCRPGDLLDGTDHDDLDELPGRAPSECGPRRALSRYRHLDQGSFAAAGEEREPLAAPTGHSRGPAGAAGPVSPCADPHCGCHGGAGETVDLVRAPVMAMTHQDAPGAPLVPGRAA